jgi:hypothetical protein
MSMRREILEGESMPWWSGFAYWDYVRGIGVTYPVPFNWIARWIRNALFVLKSSPDRGHRASLERAAYEKGYAMGFRDGERRELREFAEKVVHRLTFLE